MCEKGGANITRVTEAIAGGFADTPHLATASPTHDWARLFTPGLHVGATQRPAQRAVYRE
jgi:hypothetical protein